MIYIEINRFRNLDARSWKTGLLLVIYIENKPIPYFVQNFSRKGIIRQTE